MRPIALIERAEVIWRIFRHLGEPTEGPPLDHARGALSASRRARRSPPDRHRREPWSTPPAPPRSARGDLVGSIPARSVGPDRSVDFRTTAPIIDPVPERQCVAAAGSRGTNV
jgi:hypothetical protein